MVAIILDPRPLHAGVHFQGGSAGRAVPGGLSTNHVAVMWRQNSLRNGYLLALTKLQRHQILGQRDLMVNIGEPCEATLRQILVAAVR